MISKAAAQKALDSDSVVSPELSPFALPLHRQGGRRRSQVLVGVAEAEANLSEEKLLQVDVTDGGKVREEEPGAFLPAAALGGSAFSSSRSPSTRSSPAPSPPRRGEAAKSPPSSTSA